MLVGVGVHRLLPIRLPWNGFERLRRDSYPFAGEGLVRGLQHRRQHPSPPPQGTLPPGRRPQCRSHERLRVTGCLIPGHLSPQALLLTQGASKSGRKLGKFTNRWELNSIVLHNC